MKELSEEEISDLFETLSLFYEGDYERFSEVDFLETLKLIRLSINRDNYFYLRDDYERFIESIKIDLQSSYDNSLFKNKDDTLIKLIKFIHYFEENCRIIIALGEERPYDEIYEIVLANALISYNGYLLGELLLLDCISYSHKPSDEKLKKIINTMIISSKTNNNYSFLINFINSYHNFSYQKNIKKEIYIYLISAGKIKEIETSLNNLALSPHGDFESEVLAAFCEHCIVENKIDEMLKILKTYFSKPSDRTITFKSFSKAPYEKIFNEIKKSNIAEKDITNFLILLWYEARAILEDYTDIDFAQYHEVGQIYTSCKTKNGFNHIKFHTLIVKIIKSGKPILALYILNKDAYYRSKSDVKLWIDSYIEAFVALDKIDILAKHYDHFGASINSIELLQHMTEHYIKEKDAQLASKVVNNISLIEPTYPFIELAKNEIKKLSMLEQLSQSNIDIDNLNSLSGEEFEQLLIKKFIDLGYKVIDTPKTGDFGADIIVDTESETRFVIQCKRFKSKVNLKAVQEVVGAIPHYSGDIGIVITNSGFLSSAIKLAQSNEIELWDNMRLMKFLTGDVSFSQIAEL